MSLCVLLPENGISVATNSVCRLRIIISTSSVDKCEESVGWRQCVRYERGWASRWCSDRLTVYSWRDLPQAQHSLHVRVPQFSVTEYAGPN